MKRRFSLILSVVLAIALVAVIPFATMAFDQETEIGDVEDGYKPQGIAIHNATEFANMEPNGSYYIANDFEVTATYNADFTGKLDGNGKILTVSAPLFKNLKGEVKNLKITGTVNVSDYDAGALAQRAENATVTNVLNHANVTGSTKVIALAESEYYNFKNIDKATGTLYNTHKLAGTGGFIGSATGVCVFTDCLNLGDVNGSPAGGIVGVMGYDTDASSFTFVNCHNEGKITDVGTDVTNMPACKVDGDTGLGGIAGFVIDYKTLVFEGCTNKGAVESSLDAVSPSGGILGCYARHTNTNTNEGATATFTSCVNEGTVKAKNNCGGIMGGNNDGIAVGGASFTNCVNKADITTKSSRSGGIVGECSKASFANCENFGKITGTIHLGGMVGRAYKDTVYNNCTNNGVINGVYEGGGYQAATAGIVGYIAGNVEVNNCKNTAPVSNPNGASVGGIIGNVSDSGLTAVVTNCENSGDVMGKYYVAGIAGYCEGPFTATNCKNTAKNVTGEYRVGGIGGRLSNTVTVSKCVNYADIKITSYYDNDGTPYLYSGGILGSANNGVVADSVNYGDVTAEVGGRALGGVVGYFGAKGGSGETLIRCGNEGNISNLDAWNGGLIGYAYGQTGATYVEGCYNTGNVSGTNSSCGAIGYISVGTPSVTVKNCFFTGTYTSTKDNGVAAIVSYNSVATTSTENIYYSATLSATSTYECYNKSNQVPYNATLTEAQLASGELAYILNAAIKAADSTITEDVFYQTLGTDTHPVLDNTHKAVLKLEDGSYANEIPAPPTDTETTPEETTPEETTPEETTPEETTPEETTPEETTPEETTPEETTPVVTPEETTPEETTPVVTPEETTPVVTPEETTPVVTPEETTPEETTVVDDDPVVGDSIGTTIVIFAIVTVVIATVAALVVIKKKRITNS